MTYARIVYDMQAAISSLGVFICLWGFVQFVPCLWRVLKNQHLHPAHSACPYHAAMAVICLTGIVFAFARMDTIGFLPFGRQAAGLAYSVGMLAMVIAVALAVWAQSRAHDQASLVNWRTPVPGAVTLARILAMVVIITLAFIAVGLVRAWVGI